MRVIIKASLTFIGFSHTVVALGAPLASTTVGLHHCMSDEQDHPMARMIGRTRCLFSSILSLNILSVVNDPNHVFCLGQKLIPKPKMAVTLVSTTVGLHHCMSDEQDHPMARMIGRTQCLFP